MPESQVDTTLYSLSDAAPQPVDRRDGERHLTLFRVGSIIIDGRRELCLVKNLSAGGMLIRAYSPMTPGTPVTIELKQGETIDARVNWVNGDSAGIEFAAPVDVVDLLATSMDGPRPRMPRVEVGCGVSVRQDGNVYGLRARDISQGGLKLDGQKPLKSGAEVVVTLPGLNPMPGVVRWSDGGSHGVTFNRLIALPELVSWLQGQRDLLRKAS